MREQCRDCCTKIRLSERYGLHMQHKGHRKTRFVPLLLVVTFCFGCNLSQNPNYQGGYLIETLGVELSPAEEKQVLAEVDRGLDIICPALGVNKEELEVFVVIVQQGIARSFANVIILPETHVENSRAPIVHELAHVVLRNRNNRFFCEGVATYVQERYGKEKVFPTFSGDRLKAVLRRNKEHIRPIPRLARNNDAFEAEEASAEGRKISYIQAGSFICFLVERYGEKSLAVLNSQKELDYVAVYGTTLPALETEWKAYVFTQQ